MIFCLKKQKRKIKQCNCLYDAVEDFSSLSTFVHFQAHAVPLYCMLNIELNVSEYLSVRYIYSTFSSAEMYKKTIIKTCNVLQACQLMMCFCGANRDFWIDYKKWSLFPNLAYWGMYLVELKKEINQVTADKRFFLKKVCQLPFC